MKMLKVIMKQKKKYSHQHQKNKTGRKITQMYLDLSESDEDTVPFQKKKKVKYDISSQWYHYYDIPRPAWTTPILEI